MTLSVEPCEPRHLHTTPHNADSELPLDMPKSKSQANETNPQSSQRSAGRVRGSRVRPHSAQSSDSTPAVQHAATASAMAPLRTTEFVPDPMGDEATVLNDAVSAPSLDVKLLRVQGKGKKKASADPNNWTVEEVASWLKANGFDEATCRIFKQQEITGRALLEVQPEHYSQLGISTLGNELVFEAALEKILPADTSVLGKRVGALPEDTGRAKRVLSGMFQPFQDCAAIYQAIESMPDDLDLSDPATFTKLPFPSLLPVPVTRFGGITQEGLRYFEYMGRSKFRELQECIKTNNFLVGHLNLYLYGTSGSGKSHLLAALVYQLIREGKCVIYVPDSRALLLHPAKAIWTALRFAFYDSASLNDIENINDVDKLINFMDGHKDIYIVVDQLNALEEQNEASSAYTIIQKMKFRRRFIFSASANEKTRREADGKQIDNMVLRIFGGMSEEETKQWFIHHNQKIPPLSPEQRQIVEYLTGSIPLLLRCLFKVKTFVESDFRDVTELRKVNLDVKDFFSDKYGSLNDARKEMYLQIMKECVWGEPVDLDNRKLYDLRYFYVDNNHIGQYTCGVAFESMMLILRTQEDVRLLEDAWYSAVSQSSNNPVVRGFLAKHICLTTIATKGLVAVNAKLGRMSTVKFNTTPNFADLLATDHETCLYVPIAYNFNYMDGIILLLDRPSKQAFMFPIQFTLSMKHKQSDVEFYTKLWSAWAAPITSAGYKVESTFVWIDKKQPFDEVVPLTIKLLW